MQWCHSVIHAFRTTWKMWNKSLKLDYKTFKAFQTLLEFCNCECFIWNLNISAPFSPGYSVLYFKLPSKVTDSRRELEKVGRTAVSPLDLLSSLSLLGRAQHPPAGRALHPGLEGPDQGVLRPRRQEVREDLDDPDQVPQGAAEDRRWRQGERQPHPLDQVCESSTAWREHLYLLSGSGRKTPRRIWVLWWRPTWTRTTRWSWRSAPWGPERGPTSPSTSTRPATGIGSSATLTESAMMSNPTWEY